ncbi:hypothetical protein [Streptomyces sp. enrichment culture]|uniref:hypothetical protein n=1 Tax=Streptomyces sp. enrichment culture TaxID=1795815 RepID=UPI003F57A959
MNPPDHTTRPSRRAVDTDHTPRLYALKRSLMSVHRATRHFTDPTKTGIERDRDIIRNILAPWLPLADQRLREATRSPAQQQHWHQLINAVRHTHATCLAAPGLLQLTTDARRLLRALMEAEHPGPSVADIADHVRQAIRDGTYPPGTLLTAGRLAADTQTPTPERLDLALQDLRHEGLVALTPSHRTRVTGRPSTPHVTCRPAWPEDTTSR